VGDGVIRPVSVPTWRIENSLQNGTGDGMAVTGNGTGLALKKVFNRGQWSGNVLQFTWRLNVGQGLSKNENSTTKGN
jgi:hypothetical protein